MNHIIAIIQARMNSTRLPKKVMANINGKPLIWHVCHRLRHSNRIHNIILATSDSLHDDPISQWCDREDVECFRGSENDVLDRFYQAAKQYTPRYIVRITADCPLIDPFIVDEVIALCEQNYLDYTGNTLPATFPDGLDVEVFTFKALERTWHQASYRYQREHVTSYITEHPEWFTMENYTTEPNLSHWRLTVDESEDLEVIQRIYKALYSAGNIFNYEDIVNYISKNTDILKINNKYSRNSNYNTQDK